MLTLNACGFEPIHAKPEEGSKRAELLQMLRNITLKAPETREGNVLAAELDELLNPKREQVSKEYQLTMNLSSSEQDLVILGDATASRKRINMASSYELKRIADNKLIDSGTITYNNSYAVQDDANFAAYTVRENIEFRALTELAERYKLRMAGVFAELSLPPELRKKEEKKEDRFDKLRERDADLRSRGMLPELNAQ